MTFVNPGAAIDAVIENMFSWRHSCFHVYVGDRIEPDDKTGLGNLARYIIRACFSQKRLVYIPATKSDDEVAKSRSSKYQYVSLLITTASFFILTESDPT